MKKGIIFNIQRYCVNDGPGIRTTVFMKGCPLNCAWCHNPESKLISHQIMLRTSLCTGCEQCAKVCENSCHSFQNNIHNFNPKNCITCNKCVDICPVGALETVGKEMTVSEVVTEVLKDSIFYETSNGGVTFSGGEPFYQAEFLLDTLKELKQKGISTAIETCGFVNSKALETAAPFIDLFLYDYKLSSNSEHQKYTGVSNELILENLKLLNRLDKRVILRCPIIKGVNDTNEHFESIAKLVNKYNNIEQVDIEPYHNLGENKSLGLGQSPCCFETANDSEVANWLDKLSNSCKCKVCKN